MFAKVYESDIPDGSLRAERFRRGAGTRSGIEGVRRLMQAELAEIVTQGLGALQEGR